MKTARYTFVIFFVLTCSPEFLCAGAAFRNHGPVAQVERERRSFTTVGGDGEPVVVFRVASSILFIDARTGETEQVDIKPGNPDINYLSRDNRIYGTSGGYLVEIDVKERTVEHVGKVPPVRSRDVTSCERGLIYLAMQPNADLVVYDPGSGKLVDHAPVAEGDRRLIPMIAVDDKGWVYVSLQMGRVDLIAYNPATGERRQLLPEEYRVEHAGYMAHWRSDDGKVYTWVPTGDGGRRRYRLYEGRAEEVDRMLPRRTKTHYPGFPEGVELVELNTPSRYLVIREEGREPRRVEFDYEAAGRPPYGVAAGPDGKIYGSTGTPLRIFRFCPETESMDSWGLAGARGRPHAGHVDVMKTMGDKIYGVVYTCGLIAYDPARPFEEGELGEIENPKLLYGSDDETRNLIGRPFSIEAHPDRRHIIGGGQAARIHVRGGMVIYDTEKGEGKLYDVLEEQGVNAITVLEDGNLVVGGSLRTPTAGSPPARREAEIGIFDFAKREMTFTKVPVPGSNRVHGLVAGGDGLVYGIAAGEEFFVFDADSKEVIHREGLYDDYGPLCSWGGGRMRWDRHEVMDIGPGGMLYILFRDCLVKMDPGTFAHRRVADFPEKASAGFAISGGRLYYAAGPDLWSFDMDYAAGER